jgi:hypothetical protein
MPPADAPSSTPLGPGAPLAYWLVSEITESRYDLPDQRMRGEMDAGFFLTRDRNFIPHQYPCRTAFAAEFRNRRPVVRGRRDCRRAWLPFGSSRLDLSGFWFRPTRLAAWARTRIDADAPGMARLRLVTCGGAVLFVNGTEAGHVAAYIRNRESSADLEVALEAGPNEVAVFFDDLAERDTRFLIGLEWLEGPEARAGLPFEAAPEVVRDVEAALEAMHLDRPSYGGGEMVLVLPHAPARSGSLSVGTEGEAGSEERVVDLPLAPGQGRVVVGPAASLPPGFRLLRVGIEAGGFAASRLLAAEIAPALGPAPASLGGRIAAALEHEAAGGAPGPVTALARLATGRSGPETDAMLAAALGPIDDCHDCADFALVPLLWARIRFADAVNTALGERIDRSLLGYRYWLDEPGNDVQWYFSENHALLFHTAAYLAGSLLPQERFRRSGRSGAEQAAAGRARLEAWFDHFEACELTEFNSAAYIPIDLKGLAALQALAPDAEIRARAGRTIARLAGIVADACHRGVMTAAQGRAYEHSLWPAATLEVAAVARLLWGGEGAAARPVHGLPLLALCLRDHGLALPGDLAARALWQAEEACEWCCAQGEDGLARLYHYKTRAFAMGSAAGYRWGEWGYQETLVHARIGAEPQAQVWISHPGEAIQFGFARPSYWGGSASIPRVQQYRALAVVSFAGGEPQPDFTHAWFPRPAFEESAVAGRAAVARSGDGLLALVGGGPLEPVTRGPTAGCELRQPGRSGRWILRLGDTGDHGGLGDFAARFAGLAVDEVAEGRFVIDDPDYGAVCFEPDGRVRAERRVLDPAAWTLAGTRTLLRQRGRPEAPGQGWQGPAAQHAGREQGGATT